MVIVRGGGKGPLLTRKDGGSLASPTLLIPAAQEQLTPRVYGLVVSRKFCELL